MNSLDIAKQPLIFTVIFKQPLATDFLKYLGTVWFEHDVDRDQIDGDDEAIEVASIE